MPGVKEIGDHCVDIPLEIFIPLFLLICFHDWNILWAGVGKPFLSRVYSHKYSALLLYHKKAIDRDKQVSVLCYNKTFFFFNEMW